MRNPFFIASFFLMGLLLGGCENKEEPKEETSQGISGTVFLSESLLKSYSPKDTLYLIVHPAGVKRGAPIAVQRIGEPKFPYSFKVGPEDMMIPGGEFMGPFSIKAKLSKSGDAISQPGDLEGFSSGSEIHPGSEAIQVTIDHVVSN